MEGEGTRCSREKREGKTCVETRATTEGDGRRWREQGWRQRRRHRRRCWRRERSRGPGRELRDPSRDFHDGG